MIFAIPMVIFDGRVTGAAIRWTDPAVWMSSPGMQGGGEKGLLFGDACCLDSLHGFAIPMVIFDGRVTGAAIRWTDPAAWMSSPVMEGGGEKRLLFGDACCLDSLHGFAFPMVIFDGRVTGAAIRWTDPAVRSCSPVMEVGGENGLLFGDACLLGLTAWTWDPHGDLRRTGDQ